MLLTAHLDPCWESSLSRSQLPLLGKCVFAKEKVSVTGVLNESSLPTGKEQEELVDLWLVHLCMCGGCCQPRLSAEPQVMGIFFSSSTAEHQLC